MKVEKILVPVDGSEHALRAAQYAAELAEMFKAEILLLYCHRPFPSILGEPYYQKAVTKILNQSKELLEPFRNLMGPKQIAFTDRILEGAAGEMIPLVAETEAFDLIVMGSRGRSDLKGLFLGSVAHRVLQAASCPVLVVR